MPRQAIEIFYLLRYTDIIQQYHIGGISFMLAKKKAKDLVLDALFFISGSFLFAVSIDTFTAPNQIAAGGLTGVATMLNHLFGIPIGTANMLMNVPLLIWAYIEMGYQIIIKTIIATLLSSAMIDIMVPYLPQYQGDPLITIVFGGCLAGLGLALILMRGGTTGGTELAANLLTLHIHGFSLGKFIMAIDLIIVLVSAVVYHDYESPLYAILVIYITSKVIDAVIYGSDSGTGKMMFIISPKNNEIARRIMDDLERGVTELKSRGAYSGNEGTVLFCAVGRQEVHKTYDIIHEIDPDAFIVVDDASEITGLGFRDFHQYRQSKQSKKSKKDKSSQ